MAAKKIAAKNKLQQTYITKYSYDNMNRVMGLEYPTGKRVSYVRNGLGQITTINGYLAGIPIPLAISSNRTYRADGQLLSQTFNNGITEARSYSYAGDLESINLSHPTNALSSFKSMTFAVDKDKGFNTIKINGAANPGTANMDEKRISDFQGSTYTYDSEGNRLLRTTGSANAPLNYQATSNRIMNMGAVYDAYGNLTKANDLNAKARVFTYNKAGNLNTFQHSTLNHQGSYTYNYTGLRANKTTTETVTEHVCTAWFIVCFAYGDQTSMQTRQREFIYDVQGRLIVEYVNGQVAQGYVWDDNMLVGVVNDGTSFVITDHLGTPRAVYHEDVRLLWRWDDYGFGLNPPNQDADTDGNKLEFNMRFAGQYFDSESGLHYNWHRYYDPSMGRYMQPDPIGLAGGLNMYAYVGGNPLNYTDFMGLAVGDWWDVSANVKRTKKIAKEELSRTKGHNDIGDATRHSEWQRRSAVETNRFTAWVAGTYHELEGLVNGQVLSEVLMDLHNNSTGRDAGAEDVSVNPSDLWTLPLSDDQKNPYSDSEQPWWYRDGGDNCW